jgi:uncharacterized protein with HEPN domain
MQRDQQSLIDISDSISLIFEYLEATNWSEFANNSKDQDAVIRRLTIIGEASEILPTLMLRHIARASRRKPFYRSLVL